MVQFVVVLQYESGALAKKIQPLARYLIRSSYVLLKPDSLVIMQCLIKFRLHECIVRSSECSRIIDNDRDSTEADL